VSAERTGELERLLARAREGDSRSVGALFSRYRGLVESVCAARLGRGDLVADAVQEVFLKLMLSARQIREPGALAGWLGRVARTTAADLAVREARRPEVEGRAGGGRAPRPGPPPAPSPLEAALRGEESRRLMEALMELKPEFREVLLLRYLHSRSYREIAAVLDVPVTTVQVRLHRARRELAERWRD
jgi:RNA polymerase sigma-70 factor (ECF subfamily)